MRVGLVGCGIIGHVHAAAIAGIRDAALCAFADTDIKRAGEYSEKYGAGAASVYSTIEEMLEQERLDVVHICTPHVCHVPMSISALKRNIHVFLEKPPAISREEFRRLKQQADESQGKVGVCFQNRYNQTTQMVTELLDGGTLGRIKGGRAFITWNRNAPYYTESNWRGSLKTEGGGVLINQSIHTLDLMLLWMGMPVHVEASMQNHHLKGCVEVEDTLEAYLIFDKSADPVRASFYATTAYVSDEPVLIELTCEQGFVRIEGNHVRYRDSVHPTPVYRRASAEPVSGKAYWGNGHEACICDFYESLRNKAPVRNDLASVEHTLKTVMNIYDAARAAGTK